MRKPRLTGAVLRGLGVLMESSLAYRILREGINEAAVGVSRDELNHAEKAVSWIYGMKQIRKTRKDKRYVES